MAAGHCPPLFSGWSEGRANSHVYHAVRDFADKSAACAASPDYVKFQAVIKSAASAASLRGGRASGRLDHGLFFAIFGCTSGQKMIRQSSKSRTLLRCKRQLSVQEDSALRLPHWALTQFVQEPHWPDNVLAVPEKTIISFSI